MNLLITPLVGIVALVSAAFLMLFLVVVRKRWMARFREGHFLTTLFALLGAVLCSSGLIAAWGYEVSGNLLRQSIAQELTEFSELVGAEVAREIRLSTERLGAAGGYCARRWNTSELGPHLQELSGAYTAFHQLAIFDNSLQLLTHSPSDQGYEEIPKVSLASALDGTVHISEPFWSPVFDDYVLTITVPIRSPDGPEILGALSGHYDFDVRVSGLLESVRFGRSGYAVLVSKEGRVLAHPDSDRIGDDISSYPAVQRALVGESGSVVARNMLDEERLFFYQPLKSPATLNPAPLALLTEMLEEEATAPLSVLKEEFVLGVFVLVFVGILVSRLLAVSIRRHLTELAEVAQHVRYGDFSRKSTLSGKDALGRLAGALNQMVKGLMQRDRIKEMFGRYVTSQVSEDVLRGEVRLGGESRLVTILISDIRGFTTMSEKMDPQEVVGFLNEYFSEMVDAVFEEGGILDKFLGDGMLAVFGAFGDQPDHPLRAVRASLRMKVRLARINEARIVASKEPIAIGVGIHTEEVVVGNIGSKKRLEYTVIGDGVNTTSRVEGLNKQFSTSILITEATYEKVKDEFECRLMPETALRGKSEKMRFYEVVSSKATMDFQDSAGSVGA